ncbi:MAG: GAF domain-containing protein, partial [Nitrospirales bacterium]|nr:GAF domain-containing protein [Nitrospirales bacterium]
AEPDVNPSNQLDRKEKELEAARKISQALFQHLSVEEVVEQGLKIALEVVNCRAGSVLLANPETKELVFYHSIGDQPLKPGTAFPWTQGIAGSVFATGEPVVIKDVKEDQRHLEKIDQLSGFHTRDLIAIPLNRWEGHPIGVLEVMNKREDRLNQDDVAILMIIGAFTALAIEQARLFQEAKLAEVARILGDIGHDVKNMLMPVLCGTSLLRDEMNDVFADLPAFDPDKGRASHELCLEVIEMVANNAKRIQERVKEIADCVKGLTSPPRFAPCKLHHVVASVFDTLKLAAQEKGITLVHEGILELPVMQADESRLFNAFYNLVNNAISEVPKGGSITIKGQMDPMGKTVHVSVIDTGRGMPAEIRDTLFTARAISRKKGGTGLGTKIVKDVIEAHSGVIGVESEVNRGTIFHIHLPMEVPTTFSSDHVSS